VKITEKR